MCRLHCSTPLDCYESSEEFIVAEAMEWKQHICVRMRQSDGRAQLDSYQRIKI